MVAWIVWPSRSHSSIINDSAVHDSVPIHSWHARAIQEVGERGDIGLLELTGKHLQVFILRQGLVGVRHTYRED